MIKQQLDELMAQPLVQEQNQVPFVVQLEEVEEEKVIEVKQEAPAMTDEELMKKAYFEELEAANIQEALLLQNLKEMGEMGYYNYKVNYNLLIRCKLDLVVAMNNLCNNMVSDSIFQAWPALLTS